MGPGGAGPVTPDLWWDLAAGVYLTLAAPAAGVAVGFGWDAVAQMRHLRRTGHVIDCPGLRGWDCTCQEEPRS